MLVSGKKVAAADREREHVLLGRMIELPLVERLSLIRAQNASRIGWHVHRRFEILFLLDGATSYELPDGRTVDLRGSHFLVIAPGVRHRGVHDVRRPGRLCGMQFDPSATGAGRHTPFTAVELRRLWTRFNVGSERACAMNGELRRQVMTLAERIGAYDATRERLNENDAASLRLSVCATLLEAARQLAAPRVLEPTQTVRAATAFMDARLAEPLDVSQVAAATGCGRARLFAVFKQSTGLTPNDYLQRRRIEKSQAALADSDATVTEIALDCGFATSQYFSNVFRKYTGLTPSDYRARVRRSK